MNFKNLKFLRIFVFLLATVFLADTVYASEVMAGGEISANNSEVAEHYSDVHSDHHHDSQKSQSSGNHCSKCGHCLACFSVLPTSTVESLKPQFQHITPRFYVPDYLSYVSAQPQRPPIS